MMDRFNSRLSAHLSGTGRSVNEREAHLNTDLTCGLNSGLRTDLRDMLGDYSLFNVVLSIGFPSSRLWQPPSRQDTDLYSLQSGTLWGSRDTELVS